MKDKIIMQIWSFEKKEQRKYGIRIEFGEECSILLKYPAILNIKTDTGKKKSYQMPYDEVKEKENSLVCSAIVETENGSRFSFTDQYEIDHKKEKINISRKVDVLNPRAGDHGFSTEFAFPIPNEESRHWSDCYDVFIPGIWYRKNKGVVSGAFGSDLYMKDFLFRVTRMALPYVQMRHDRKNFSVSICHQGPVPDTSVLEVRDEWIVDEGLQYPSIGFSAGKSLELKYVYPGTEGEVSYIGQTGEWARRSHPVRKGVPHKYQFAIHFGKSEDVYEALRKEWRYWYDIFQPEVHECDLEQVYRDGMELLDTYCQPYNEVMGLPFWTAVPEGSVCDISFQMGFVGQQTQCAYQLIRCGVQTQNDRLIDKGKRIIDFWVRESEKNSVFPQVWYDVFPPRFKPGYPTYLRTVAEGVEGILTAYLYLKKYGEDQQNWLAFCKRFADNLEKVQEADGSFARAYGKRGEVIHEGKYNTSNVIRFLVNFYFATGEEKYKAIALKGGEFCYSEIYKNMAYIGGTADNDNTIDKEAGMQALYSFMALYDLTGEMKWIEAAKGAADFCETWTYSWKFPVHPYKGSCVFDRVDQTGLSLIATGHSHCDVMMGYCPYDYFRLWILTQDPHYLKFANMILHNTKQTTDWKREYGYSYAGLVEESGELALQYHNGLGKWLPWCTIAEIEALTRLQEFFGSMDIKNCMNISDKNMEKCNYSQFFRL